jgi:rRNA maturation endonuclease Nob1
MVCKGICQHHKAIKPKNGGGRYISGQKRCQVCQVYINWKGDFCPCCGYRLRTKPRNRKFKLKFRDDQSKISNSNHK